MLPKLVWNVGVVAVAAGLTLVATGAPRVNPKHNVYAMTISKNSSGGFVIADKLPTYSLDFHGSVVWNVENLSGEEVDFSLADFQHSGPRKCPLAFTHNTGNSQICVGTRRLRDQQSRFIRVERGDTDPSVKEKFRFAVKINGTTIDPEIEIDRDPYSRFDWIKWVLVSGGVASLLTGWWLLRKR